MSVEQNRGIVLGFFADLSAGRGKDALSALHDEATWHVAGKPGSPPLAGQYSKSDLPKLFAMVGAAMPDGITMTITATTAEDDRVTVEASVHGISPAGRIYDNRICFVAEVRDGKIHALREYYDTIHTNDVLFGNTYAPATT